MEEVKDGIATETLYYVYGHKDPRTQQYFYIGSGTGNRAYDTNGRPKKWRERVREYRASGLVYQVEILHVRNNYRDAMDLEKIETMLKNATGHPLTNVVNKKRVKDDLIDLERPRVLGEFVRKKRLALNLTQADVAKGAKLGLRFVIDTEKGKPTLQISKVRDLISFLGARLTISEDVLDDAGEEESIA